MLRRFYRIVYVPAKELREIDLGIPVFGDKRPLSSEVFERLKADGDIVEKLAPLLILEKYLGSKDYLELKQLYKSLLSTPGEPRIIKNNLIKSIRRGVEEGHFGFGVVRDGQVECIRFKETPEITLQEYEAIVRKELCERIEEGREESTGYEVDEGGAAQDTTEPPDERARKEPVTQPSYKGVTLNIKLPKGKFYEFYKGVLSLLENSFDETDVEIKIEAKKGRIPKSDYENKVKETLIQIDAQIVNEETEESEE